MGGKKEEVFSIDSSAVIAGLASGLGSFCKEEHQNYYKCKHNNSDPEGCLPEAIDARRCNFALANLYLDPKYGCDAKFTSYVKCLRERDFSFRDCYDTRLDFESCASEKFGIEFPFAVPPRLKQYQKLKPEEKPKNN
ncbi:hypothetical protein AKO1_003885 [Acrasis kona]|uniref:NADH dehydrogenase [ubiquinone] 1 alpha subcomplex subunit 8 n=1 Tax=Acrasis kona TaxID=1008807 RepID=A0AAW2ZJG3_9EUKA